MIHLGSGAESSVDVDPNDPGKVIKNPQEGAAAEKVANFVKARFYLTKILHELLPENIPDVYLEALNAERKPVTRSQRVYPDAAFTEYMSAKRLRDTPSKDGSENFYDLSERHKSVIKNDPAYRELTKLLSSLHVSFDSDPANFTRTVDNKFVYLDRVFSLLIGEQEGLQRLKNEINKRVPEEKQNKVKQYLQRYIELCSAMKLESP